jgi:lipoate-protein ligase B
MPVVMPTLFKVASLGIAITRWVTTHGFALNVDTDLTRFRTINPCGLDSAVMASMRSLGATIPPHDTLVAHLHHHVAAAFHRSPQ